MRKTIATIIVAGTLLTTGCSSTSPWDGVSYQERQDWSGIGIQAFDAKNLRQNGFTPSDTKPWVQLGITTPEVIMNWHRAGFSAEQTTKWLKKDLTLKEAIELTN